jgi:macrolide transport system ATP-binding/permease protein
LFKDRTEPTGQVILLGGAPVLILGALSNDEGLFNSEILEVWIPHATATIALLVASIGLISLLVGGIGVINIMLVSVTERTQEIGVRMAVGARQTDILRQFLIEAVLVCAIGGALGVGLALQAGAVLNTLDVGIRMIFSTASIVGAFALSSTLGIMFGFVPASNAARLDPVNAHVRE